MALKEQAAFSLTREQVTEMVIQFGRQAEVMQKWGAMGNDQISGMCSAIATMIASADGIGRQNLMDAANAVGFIPEYYCNSIRVTWRGRLSAV
jgi:hypothetical protein